MSNPETVVILGTQDTEGRQTKHKSKTQHRKTKKRKHRIGRLLICYNEWRYITYHWYSSNGWIFKIKMKWKFKQLIPYRQNSTTIQLKNIVETVGKINTWSFTFLRQMWYRSCSKNRLITLLMGANYPLYEHWLLCIIFCNIIYQFHKREPMALNIP